MTVLWQPSGPYIGPQPAESWTINSDCSTSGTASVSVNVPFNNLDSQNDGKSLPFYTTITNLPTGIDQSQPGNVLVYEVPYVRFTAMTSMPPVTGTIHYLTAHSSLTPIPACQIWKAAPAHNWRLML